jgi:O-acetyl-ADP-ribose deacetylase (regulator of RNase III)
MINYTRGDLLHSTAEALVNTVNEVGVMGKGVALMFRETYPESAKLYQEAAKAGQVRVGRVYPTPNPELVGPRWIIHFPTKRHWRHPSKLEWIREGLQDLARVIQELGIASIALPPLGCGSGGLEWTQVRREIEMTLGELTDVAVTVYEPSAAYLNAPKRTGVEQLTPARALIAELVRRYLVLGTDCTNLEVHKLAWFLWRSFAALQLDDPLKLAFKANKFGPYADNLRHLLDNLDGSYLHCEKRLSDAGPFDLIWFEDSRRESVEAYLKVEAAEWQQALIRTADLIDGFESPLGMELLATVDWLLASEEVEPTLEGIRKGLSRWSGGKAAARRKQQLFDDRLLQLALNRLATTDPLPGHSARA